MSDIYCRGEVSESLNVLRYERILDMISLFREGFRKNTKVKGARWTVREMRSY